MTAARGVKMSDYAPSRIVATIDVSDMSLIDAEKLLAGIRTWGPSEYGQRTCIIKLICGEVA